MANVDIKHVVAAEAGSEFKQEVSAAKKLLEEKVGKFGASVLLKRPTVAVSLANVIRSQTSASAIAAAKRVEDLFQAVRSPSEEERWEKWSQRVLDAIAVRSLKSSGSTPDAGINVIINGIHQAFSDPQALEKAAYAASGGRQKLAAKAFSLASRLEAGRRGAYYPLRSEEHKNFAKEHSTLIVKSDGIVLKLGQKQTATVQLPEHSGLSVIHHGQHSEASSIKPVKHEGAPAYEITGDHSVELPLGSVLHIGGSAFALQHHSPNLVKLSGVSGPANGRAFEFKNHREICIGRSEKSHIRLFA